MKRQTLETLIPPHMAMEEEEKQNDTTTFTAPTTTNTTSGERRMTRSNAPTMTFKAELSPTLMTLFKDDSSSNEIPMTEGEIIESIAFE